MRLTEVFFNFKFASILIKPHFENQIEYDLRTTTQFNSAEAIFLAQNLTWISFTGGRVICLLLGFFSVK